MKKLFLLIIATALANSAYCQHTFLYEAKNLDFIRSFEDSINSNNLGYIKTTVAKDYFPTAISDKDYYPICFLRTNDPFYPQLHVKYFYNEVDSTLLASSYDWNIMDYVTNLKSDGHKFDDEIKKEKEYLNKYQSIKDEIIRIFGDPESVEENETESDYFYRLRWDEGSINILVLLKFSKKLKQLPGDMKFGSYNIRVKIDYIK